jgi:uncharacterized protein YkwD
MTSSCKKDDTTNPDGTSTPTEVIMPRQAAINEYEAEYLGSIVSSVGWTGSVIACNPGTVAAGVDEKVMRRINYYRKLVGLQPCTHDAVLGAKAQKAALMMEKNNTLSHQPVNTWGCYSADGRDAAQKSNLAQGATAADAVDMYMIDNGTNNSAVGHRRWLLYSKAKTFGHGSTKFYNAIYVMHNTQNSAPTNLPEYIAYPLNYMVNDLFRPNMRWSCSIPGANFGSAVITVKYEDGTSIPVTRETVQTGIGDNSVVFIPSINSLPNKDAKYTVTITGIKPLSGNSLKTVTYDVYWIKR